jgi:hypothetical protein
MNELIIIISLSTANKDQYIFHKFPPVLLFHTNRIIGGNL